MCFVVVLEVKRRRKKRNSVAVYSPMIPLMLAKNAGVKGAVDFVRDIRSLP